MAREEAGAAKGARNITFRVQRFNPETDSRPYMAEYTVPYTEGMTVLDGLIYIKEKLDGTLAFRMSCRMGICGSCGMLVNGFPHLACHTQVSELESDVLEVKPLPNYPVIRDLVPDLGPMFEKHREVKPYIIRADEEELENRSGEFLQKPEELEAYLQFAYCLKCGMCLAACPTVATDRAFFGPQALAQAYRYSADSRDAGQAERLEVLNSPHGPWRCHLAGACSEACPKGVDPALAIQLLKRELTLGARRQEKQEAVLAGPPEGVSRRPNIPDPPARTVEPEQQ